MNISNYVKKMGISVYSLSKKSSVPYTTLSSICNGSADLMECRAGTLVKISEALNINLLDMIHNNLSAPVKYNFINADVAVDESLLPKAMNTIKELEDYDRNNDTMFYECADMLYMMADRFLKDGAIDRSTYEKLIMKYPIA